MPDISRIALINTRHHISTLSFRAPPPSSSPSSASATTAAAAAAAAAATTAAAATAYFGKSLEQKKEKELENDNDAQYIDFTVYVEPIGFWLLCDI